MQKYFKISTCNAQAAIYYYQRSYVSLNESAYVTNVIVDMITAEKERFGKSALTDQQNHN